MSKLSNISGFPEWLPEEKLIEDALIEKIKKIFQSHGFSPIETPAIELKSTLSSKGVIDKEIYILKRALADPSEKESDEELALHFDLTVPFARYVAQHLNKLVFPFKRYQLQKVWRGERPQKGRFREFYQFDIDCIARENLPLSLDAEVLTVIAKAFHAMNIGKFTIRVNNRKILLGIYDSLGLSPEKQKEAIRIVDKLDKIGAKGISEELQRVLSLDPDLIEKIVALTTIRSPLKDTQAALSSLSYDSELFRAGMNEISLLSSLIPEATRENIIFDLSLARGLDYYTGTIFEVFLPDFPEFGTVSSGGRYEDLAGQFINQKLPGVGGSIGITRLMDLILKNELIKPSKKSPTTLLVTVYNEDQRPACNNLAEISRSIGLNTEVFPLSPKLGKQIDYASAKGIPFVLFYSGPDSPMKIKNIASREEVEVSDLSLWCKTFVSSNQET